MNRMRLRATQFACLLVLLSAFGATGAVTRTEACRNCAALYVLLQQIGATSAAQASGQVPGAGNKSNTLLPAERTLTAHSWTMRPPAAQAVGQHANTGSGL